MTPQPPSARQLNYLRDLANRTGQTFAWPKTKTQASREVQRLKNTRLQRTIERLDLGAEQAAREANCDVPVERGEVQAMAAIVGGRIDASRPSRC